MSEVTAPWEWDCGCGLRNGADHAFCWGCGKPAHTGRRTTRQMGVGAAPPATHQGPPPPWASATHPEAQPMTGPFTGPPAATFCTPFRIVDERGRTVLAVDSGPEGARLHLCNNAGTPVVSISVVENGGAVTVCNGVANKVVVITATPEGGAVGVSARNGETRSLLGADATGGFVGVCNPNGSRAAQLRGSSAGGQLSLFDAQGRPYTEA